MAIGWFIIPYKRRPTAQEPRTRYPAIDDYTADIKAEGGQWAETEVLGDCCIVKVRASDSLLSIIAAVDGFQRLPKDRLDDPLSDLSIQALKLLRDTLTIMGYTLEEIKDEFGNDISLYTLRDVLLFATGRRLKPRYDILTDEIILDGPIQPVRPLVSVDAEVTE